jgi:hypothetical protein
MVGGIPSTVAEEMEGFFCGKEVPRVRIRELCREAMWDLITTVQALR